MRTRATRRGFTLIELLVVMGIVLVLAAMLLAGISAAKKYVARARTKTMIDSLGLALGQFKEEFGAYPPGGTDNNEDGDCDDPGEKTGAGEPGDTLELMRLRAICEKHEIKNTAGVVERTVGPYYSPNKMNIRNGAVVDIFGSELRYLADGRRKEINPGTGEPFKGRVYERIYVIWSIAEDLTQDAENNNLDDNGDGKVDDTKEMENDIGSWQ